MTEQISKIIESLSDALGVAASELYSVMTLQAKVSMVKSVVEILLLLFAMYMFWRYVRKVYIEKDKDGCTIFERAVFDDDFLFALHLIATIVIAALTIIFAISVVFDIDNIIQCIMNPRYWALEKIIKMLKL